MDENEDLSIEESDEGLQPFRDYMAKRNANFEQVLARINSEFGCNLCLTCQACPVQIEGTIDDKYLYFRARWDAWRLTIAETDEQAVRAIHTSDVAFYHRADFGLSGFDASCMEPEQVEVVLRACLTAFWQGQTSAGDVEL